MTYRRVVMRNRLRGDYGNAGRPAPEVPAYGLIAGDLRRLERDQRDDAHLAEYARKVGITEAQALHVLDLFFDGDA